MARNSSWSAPGFYSNLTNGVSQQPPRVRLDSQQDEAINMYPTTFHQMAFRPPLEIVSELDGLDAWLDIDANGYPGTHSYERDNSEAYDIFFDGNGDLKVFDKMTGTEKTVNILSSDSYLDNATPETGFFCLTYKDTTFVVNRASTVTMNATLSTTRTSEALIRVKDYVSGATYSVTVKFGATTITVAPTGTTVNTVAADIVTKLAADVNWPSGVTLTQYSNVVHISKSTLTSVSVSDNRAGTAIQSFMDKVLKVGDLTPYAPEGYIVRVTGSSSTASAQDANTSDDQFYKFVSDGGSGGSGTWTETVAPGIKYSIDAATAPHKLVRNALGEFDFDVIDWGTRDVGDETTNPNPLFIDQTIHSAFLLGNRLGFIAGNTWMLSRVGEEQYYEFFRSTTAAALDDDPVYGIIPSTEVNKSYWPISWNGELVIFGDKADGVVNYGNKLALSNLNISTPTVSGITPYAAPILSGSDLLFVSESGNYSNLSSYQLDTNNPDLRVAESITEDYLGRYIPNNVKRLVGRVKSFVAILSTETRDKLYIMTYSKKAGKLIQQAIVTWDFSTIPDMDILNITVEGAYLNVTFIGPGGKVYVGRIDTSAGASDDGFPRKCYMDYRMSATGTYDPLTDLTTFTLPYALTDGDKRAVIRSIRTDEMEFALGQSLTIAESTDSTLKIRGDLSDPDISIFVGYGYTGYFVPNPIYARIVNPSTGQRTVDMLTSTTINRIVVGFFNTQYFKVEVISRQTGRTISEREFRGALRLDNIDAKLDDNGVTFNGKIIIDGVNSDADDIYLKISSNETLPFFVDSIQWLAGGFSAEI